MSGTSACGPIPALATPEQLAQICDRCETSTAAAAVCHLGLENWPATVDADLLLTQDLVAVFQTRWTVLHGVIAATHGATHVRASAFESIGDNRQIALVDDFLRSLPERLGVTPPDASSHTG